MPYFLLEYDRPAGKLLHIREYSNAERDAAYEERRRCESTKLPHVEVVILEGASRDDIERTHSRYFRTLEELASN